VSRDRQPTHAGAFALGTFADAGGDIFAGLVVGDEVQWLDRSTRHLLEDWDKSFHELERAAEQRSGAWIPLSELDVQPPIEPRQVLQSGANYRKHVVDIIMSERSDYGGRTEEEVRAEAEEFVGARARQGTPYVFIGLASAMCGAYDDIVLPPTGNEHDWELELAAIIGAPARHVSADRALQHVAAYTICNDLTTRDRVYRPDMKKIGTDWFAAKNSPTFTPTGPFLVPAQYVGDPMDLRITLRHNGQTMQDESTKDMIFDIASLVSYASSVVELTPGDLLLTGSPAGNGAHWGVYLAPGDVMDSEITGLGYQRNTCVAAPD
jgi:2-keto-4-pentenoate hydratase/2-oxohepta-3-ene-1,7-dioic acid hydratase in catechol pathway